MNPLVMAFAASLACNSPPGTVVARLLPTGGDGKAITFSIVGDTADFRIRGTVIVVNVNGIDPTHCGSTRTVTVTASQQ
jgi:hypothetical protein